MMIKNFIFAMVLMILLVAPLGMGFEQEESNVDSINDAKQFMGGFILGFAKIHGDVSNCVVDSTEMVANFDSAMKEMEQGFKDRSISEMEDGVKKLGTSVHELLSALSDCGFKYITEDVIEIAMKIAEDPKNIIEIVLKEGIHIFHERKNLSDDFREMIKDWRSDKYFPSGFRTGEIFGILVN
eukprot:gb/GECH01011344.1/.p1 GENE.gb/GECH01011344.1/~~gb/GECH01011344.1/.p1  ORF type:complete len:183 (+),score=45.11 gb/GECH01011344.1/:1-549(+)